MDSLLAQYIDGLHKTYGHCVRISPNEVSFSDINSHRTLHSAGSQFRKSDWYKKFTNSEGKFDSPGLFAMTDPREHGNRKRLFSQQFSNSSIMSKKSVIRAKIHMAVDKFSRDAHVNGFADIMKWWTFLATDVIAELSFGESFGLLETEEKNRYVRDLETTMMITGIRSETMPAFNLLQYLPIKKLQVALDTSPRLDAYGLLAIQNHKEFIMRNPDVSNCLFSRFLDPTKNKAELSDHQLAQEAGNPIVAGSDTTSVSLTFLTYALLRPCNRAVRDKLIDGISSLPIDAPAKDIMMLPYLRKVIEESLRIYGGGPSLPRVVPSSGAILAGYNIPAGTTVRTQTFTMMRDSDIFHDPLR
ncbi:cytochrome P450 [Penicillium malachiteum]|nr:cytochrome P450 [Penicillium malachiteum]